MARAGWAAIASTGFDPTDKGFFHGGDHGSAGQLDYIRPGDDGDQRPSFVNQPVRTGEDPGAGYPLLDADFLRIGRIGTNDEDDGAVDGPQDEGLFLSIVALSTSSTTGGTYSCLKGEFAGLGCSGSLRRCRELADVPVPTLSAATSFPCIFDLPQYRTPTAKTRVGSTTRALQAATLHLQGESSTCSDFGGLDDLVFTEPEGPRAA
ncbi:MAG: hypothetical protein U0Q10_05425 [Dermatophilaceae bacterium]